MVQTLRVLLGLKITYIYPLILALCYLPVAAQGQQSCPPATSACTPGSAPAANLAFRMGILNVTLGSFSNPTIGAQDGYKDYSCTLGAVTLPIGADVPLSVQTNPDADENVRVWADLNNDGSFGSVSELVFSSDAKRVHTGTLRLPASTAVGMRLRLRIAADYVNAPLPTPCSTPQYSQTEDYALVAVASTAIPLAEFTVDQPRTCSGSVRFTDQSQNGPTSWRWDFGDGTTSTLQNPSHRYTTVGTYSVRLTVANSLGSHTTTKGAYIVYDNLVPVAAACTPSTAAYCCGYGITKFSLGPLTQVSGNGQSGYEDFTCSGKVELAAGGRYPLSLTTSPTNPQDTRVWLDLNNDGTFGANELLFQALNTTTPTGTLVVPGTAILNQPLRLRVVSDFAGSAFSACAGIQLGQAEDYTVTVRPNTSAPVAAFASNYLAGSCQSTIQFTDQSQNVPTSWRWNFGDGTTSSAQNPTHTYSATGIYTVSLTTSNDFGTNTLTQANYIVVALPCLTYCAAVGANSNFWITSVSLASPQTLLFSNSSAADPSGYGNYVGQVMTLHQGQPATLTVTTNASVQRVTSVWVDWNQNGEFGTNEEVASLISNNPTALVIQAPASQAKPGLTRMRIMVRLNTNIPNPCTGSVAQPNTEIEDYTVQVLPPTVTANTEASSLPTLTVFPNPTSDGRLHMRLTDASATDTYLAEVYNLLGACVQKTTIRLGSTQEQTLDISQLPKGLYVLRLHGSRGQLAVRRILRN